MNVTIQPSGLNGAVHAPASKSSMQRACAAALLRKGVTVIDQAGHSNDDKAAMQIITKLGANISGSGERIIVTSNGFPSSINLGEHLEINCGESGLGIRMFTPIAALSGTRITITGEGSLRKRPMDFFDATLPLLGVDVRSSAGKLPITIKGPLVPRNVTIDGSVSSQFLTGLLMAYSASISRATGFDEAVTITVQNLKSRPYVDLTLDLINHFGFAFPENVNYREFIFHPGSLEKKSTSELSYTVEGDWSGGAFLLVAGAIAGPVTVRGLDIFSSQADKAIIDVLMAADAGIAIEAKGIVVHPGNLQGFHFDATDAPDLFPPIAALAAYCEGQTVVKGVSRLRHKESDRGVTLQKEFLKLGVKIGIDGDDMIIDGGGKLRGATVNSNHDHRIAMACSIASLNAQGNTVIEEAEAVKKSYPGFYEDLQKLGAAVSLDNKFKWHE